jgi:ubiquinone/menaquinone biosynthesis C-methylase UbiE
LSHFKRYVDEAEVIVDVGCGSGAFSKALVCEKRLVIALDIEKRLLKEVEGSFIERMCADAHNLPLRDSSVDCVLSFSLLEHLKDPRRSVEELYRVLKYGGTAVIQLPNLQYPFEPHTKWPLLCLMPKKLQKRILKMIGCSYVNMEVTIKNALSMLEEAGFKLKETVKVYHLGIMKLLPQAPAYIFMARKIRQNS